MRASPTPEGRRRRSLRGTIQPRYQARRRLRFSSRPHGNGIPSRSVGRPEKGSGAAFACATSRPEPAMFVPAFAGHGLHRMGPCVSWRTHGAGEAEAGVVVPVGRVVVVPIHGTAVPGVVVPDPTPFHAVRPRRCTFSGCPLLPVLENALESEPAHPAVASRNAPSGKPCTPS